MSLQKLFPFIEHNLVEYEIIFPNINNILNHLLYVIGNGYGWHSQRGIPVHESGKCIDEFPAFTDARWKKLIKATKLKERDYYERSLDTYKSIYASEPAKLQEHALKFQRKQEAIQPVVVTEDQFSYQSLYKQLAYENGIRVGFKRPYPVCQYSAANYIDKNSPQWFIRLARNSAKAWKCYLNEEIRFGNYTVETENKSLTLLQRDLQIMTDFVTKFEAMFEFQEGDKVTVVRDDPNWRYGGCARPKIGDRATIVPIEPWRICPETEGKVGASFDETELGYEKSDKGDIVLYLPTFQLRLE